MHIPLPLMVTLYLSYLPVRFSKTPKINNDEDFFGGEDVGVGYTVNAVFNMALQGGGAKNS